MPHLLFCILLLVGALRTHAEETVEEVHQAPELFLRETFGGQAGEVPPASVLWLNRVLREETRAVLGHDYPALRIRYWRTEHPDGTTARTAWILEEIGKVKPITTGLVVRDGEIERVKVLIYRESHGWEVKHPFFTNQFQGVSLTPDGALTRTIDGIAGATLSVNALARLSRLALVLDAGVRKGDRPATP